MLWGKPMTLSMAEILQLQEGVQIPLRTHLVDVACLTSSGTLPRMMKAMMTVFFLVTDKSPPLALCPGMEMDLICSKKTMLKRQTSNCVVYDRCNTHNNN